MSTNETTDRHTLEGGPGFIRCAVLPSGEILLKDTRDGHMFVLTKDEGIDLMAWLSEVTA